MNPHEQARAWRERQGLSRAELATLVGYSAEAVQAIEAGKRDERTMRRYKAACLLVSILRSVNRPELSVESWQWGLNRGEGHAEVQSDA